MSYFQVKTKSIIRNQNRKFDQDFDNTRLKARNSVKPDDLILLCFTVFADLQSAKLIEECRLIIKAPPKKFNLGLEEVDE